MAEVRLSDEKIRSNRLMSTRFHLVNSSWSALSNQQPRKVSASPFSSVLGAVAAWHP